MPVPATLAALPLSRAVPGTALVLAGLIVLILARLMGGSGDD